MAKKEKEMNETPLEETVEEVVEETVETPEVNPWKRNITQNGTPT